MSAQDKYLYRVRVLEVLEALGIDGKHYDTAGFFRCPCPSGTHDAPGGKTKYSCKIATRVGPAGESPGLCKCDACDFKCDLIGLVRHVTGLGFNEAREWLVPFGAARPECAGGSHRPRRSVVPPAAEPEQAEKPRCTIPEKVIESGSAIFAHEKAARDYLLTKRAWSGAFIDEAEIGIGTPMWGDGQMARVIQIPVRDEHRTLIGLWYRTFRDEDLSRGLPKCWSRKGTPSGLLWPLHLIDRSQPVVVAEGEMDAGALQSLGINAITAFGGANQWKLENFKPVIEPGPGSEVILVPDNDPAGKKAYDSFKQELLDDYGVEKVVVVDVPELANDIEGFLLKLKEDERRDAWDQLLESARKKAEKGDSRVDHIRLLTLREAFELPPRKPMIDSMLNYGELAVIYGPPGCGKTFFSIMMAVHLAGGESIAGRQGVDGGVPVAYISGEGRFGILPRIKAAAGIRLENDDDPVYENLMIVDTAVQFLSEEELGKLLELIKALPVKPALVIIDTLARCIVPGDDSASKDMNRFVAACDAIIRETGGSVLVIHHTNKGDEQMERGSGALRGAADLMLNATMRKNRIKVDCNKMREGVGDWTLDFELEPRDRVADDAKGRPISSACLRWLSPAKLADVDAAKPLPAELQGKGVATVLAYLMPFDNEEPASAALIAKETKVSRSRVQEVLKSLRPPTPGNADVEEYFVNYRTAGKPYVYWLTDRGRQAVNVYGLRSR